MKNINYGYKPNHPLFKALTGLEVQQFKKWTHNNLKEINLMELEIIHPIIRIELLNIIEDSLVMQGEL